MEIIIKNDELEVKIDSFGAELISLVDIKKNKEYIWQKNPEFWNKSSPILFPFIGVLKENRYFYKDKEYKIDTRHGFARDNEFEIVNQTGDSVEFLFIATEKTKEIYPFNFKLYLKYILKGKSLNMEYRVENLENDKLYFSLGAHPAFYTPIADGDFSDYYIQFENKEDTDVLLLNGILIDSKIKKCFSGDKITLKKDSFIDDAMILRNPKSNKIYLKNDKNGYNVKFEYDGFNYIAFWNIPGAEFVCLEPWNGISDYDNSDGKLENKVGIEVLGENDTYIRNLKIEIL